VSDDPDDRSDETRTGLPELTRKILTLGLGAYFLGEDAIKRAVKETKLPREIVSSVVTNAAKGKEELLTYVARELSNFLRQMDVQAELSRFASTHKIRVSAEIEFIPRTPPAVAETPAKSSGSDVGPVVSDLDVRVQPVDSPPEEEDDV
jgi:hypothetical protein